ncbi:unnamed protein product [Auanema sp. JU1783]|nr:unnamed protein product [Auanema sp. JU1783]
MQPHIGVELIESFRDGKYDEAEGILGSHPELFENLEYLMDYLLIVESHLGTEASDVTKHFISILNLVPLGLAVDMLSKLCSTEYSTYSFETTAEFIFEKFPLIEKDEKLMEIFIYSLPYELEKRITSSFTNRKAFADILAESVMILKIYNSSTQLKFYKFPKMMRSIVGKPLFSNNVDADEFFSVASRRIAFHPVLVYYKNAKFIPWIHSTSHLLEHVIDSLVLYLQDFAEDREDAHYPSILATMAVIAHNMSRSFSVQKIHCIDLLVFNVIPYIQDFTLEDNRVRILGSIDSILLMISDVSRVLILKHLAERVVQVNKKIEGDSLILAWIIDHFKRNLSVECFREELATFWTYFEKLMYEDVEGASSYYTAVFTLAASQALLKLDKAMMANVKRRILEPLQDQISDYVRLQDVKQRCAPNIVDNMAISDAEHIDLVTRSYHLKNIFCNVIDYVRSISYTGETVVQISRAKYTDDASTGKNCCIMMQRAVATGTKSVSRAAAVAAGVFGGTGAALIYALENSVNASSDCVHPYNLPWAHSGAFSSFDIASVRRGYEVYKQVCAACHSLKFIHYRHFVDTIMTEEEAKAEAADALVNDVNDKGQAIQRPGILTDKLPDPYPNKKAAAAANNGAAPPDLSLMALARHGGDDYVFSLLTGYLDAPAGIKVDDGKAYNPYFAGGIISMPQQLFDEGIEYKDGTPATQSQQAKDVSTFMHWCAEPFHDTRKKWALKILAITPVVALILLYGKRNIWTYTKNQKFLYKTVKGREPPKST